MTATRKQPETFQSMLDWLEGELRQVKAQLAEYAGQVDQNRTQLWDLLDQVQTMEGESARLDAQSNAQAALPEELRSLRERNDRVQEALVQERDQRELLARQIQAEMQADRDDRGELRRRTESAEQAAAAVKEKLAALEETLHHAQDDQSLLAQRMEQGDINMTALNSRFAANAETLRRAQAETRALAADQERHERWQNDADDRFEQAREIGRRVQEEADKLASVEAELEVMRGRAEALRANSDTVTDRSVTIARDHEVFMARVDEMERNLERQRVKADQHDRALADIQLLTQDAREHASREAERFLVLQEKVRQRQIADLEQEIREIKGYGRSPSDG